MATNTITVQFGGSIDLNLHLAASQPEIACIVRATVDRFTATAKGFHMAYTLPVDHLIVVQVAYVDAEGNPAAVDSVTWSASNTTLVDVEPDPQDATMCKITPIGAIGAVQVTADADADLGEGVRHLITTMDISLVGGEAVAGTINPVGDPQPIGPHVEHH